MIRRSPIAVIAAALGVGIAALALIPGQQPASATAAGDSAQVALASVSSPNPDLLKRLDAEVAPPPVIAPTKAAAAEDDSVASVQPVSLTTGVDLAAPTATAAPTGPLKSDTVGGSAVNLRSGPSSSSSQLSVLQPGEAIQTGQVIGGWVQVTRADGSTGWVYSTYLSSGSAGAPRAQTTQVASAQPRAVIKGDTGDLEDKTARIASRLPAYARPRDSAESIFTFQPGDQVRIAEVRGDWLRVETDDGISAWIRR